LTALEGNVRRTAKNLGIPVPTVRRWRDEWRLNGVPEKVRAEIAPIVSDFLTDALRIRGKLLLKLEQLVDDGKVTPRDVTTALGVLSDKIRAYENVRETQKVEHTLNLPPADEIRELFAGMLEGMVDAARLRAAEIEAIEEEPLTTTYRELAPIAEGGTTP
jgi:hypothetical protein